MNIYYCSLYNIIKNVFLHKFIQKSSKHPNKLFIYKSVSVFSRLVFTTSDRCSKMADCFVA